MSTSNIIGIPTDDKAFEENCVPLFAKLLNDPNVKLVGIRGKGQSGMRSTNKTIARLLICRGKPCADKKRS